MLIKRWVLAFFLLLASSAFAAPAPWCDLPIDDYSKLARFEDSRFETLNLKIQKYHSIPKSHETHFQARIIALQDIVDFLSSWIQEEKVKSRRSFLANIQKNAANKKWYLEELDYRSVHGQFGTEFLKSYHQDLSVVSKNYAPIFLCHQRLYDSNLGIYWGEYWFETIDPCHRQLSHFYDHWLKQGGKEDSLLSFFLWLEDQYIPSDIVWVNFLNETQLKDYAVSIENSLLYFYSKGEKVLVHCDNDEIEYIFNIDGAGCLFIAPTSKTIRHISISHGKPVLAAGNIRVNQGHIKALQLESGHYQPLPEHGLQMIELFKELGVSIDPSIPFSYYDSLGKHKTTLGEFLCAFK